MTLSRPWSASDFSIPVPDLLALTREETNDSAVVRCVSRSPPPYQPEAPSPFPKLTAIELRDLMRDPLCRYERIIIFDARFDYEFKGGHIISAINVLTQAQIQSLFERYRSVGENVLVVFHCEFSRSRGPALMQSFREFDRQVNFASYPNVCFPNICLLEGGYKQFYTEVPELCTGGYVPMRDKKHVVNGDLRRSHSAYAKDLHVRNTAAVVHRSSSIASCLAEAGLVFTRSASQ